MERNDAVMPMVSIVIAAIMWVLVLFIFNAGTHAPEVEISPELQASAATAWPTIGQAVYTGAEPSCAGCHGAEGQGGAGPALVGNDDILNNPSYVINIIQKGQGIMPAYGEQLSAEQVLAVTNYIRNSFGNEAEVVGPEVLQEAVSGVSPEILRVRSRFVPEHIELPQIFLVTFVMLLLTYGVIGLYSVWAEGVELKPGIHHVRSSPMAILGMVVALGSTILFSVLFAMQIIRGLQGVAAEEPVMPAVTAEGFYSAMIFLSLAAALGLYKKYFMNGEALVEDASGEFPW